tara:strand:- start:2 stop:1729 length:1728 start_codon:yes stop_codon:yes gene_type:complete
MKTAVHIQGDYRRIRSHCGFFSETGRTLLALNGPDVFSYLQTQTTNDVNSLEIGNGQNSAIVTRQGKLVCTFSIHKTDRESVLILVETKQKDNLINHLNSFLFRDRVEIVSNLQQNYLIGLQGPKSSLLLEKLSLTPAVLPEKPNDTVLCQWDKDDLIVINKTLSGEEGYILAFPQLIKKELESAFYAVGMPYKLASVGPEALEILRIESGIPLYGIDMDQSQVLPETGLEHSSVSYNKGCYIGQEVIARIKTYGSPALALTGLVFEGYEPPPYNGELRLNGKKIGIVKSSCYSYALEKYIALAYVDKDHRSPDLILDIEINGNEFKAVTAILPFYQTQSRIDHAINLHSEAIKYFRDEDNLERPITLLREAVELAPKYAPAYEALGVLLSRQDKFDEAISLMKRLAEIDPKEIMAHTNLSIYYMKQGRIEDAEKEKAEATTLQFEKIMADKISQKSREKLEKEKKQDQENKIEMFLDVLKIDPTDQVANFGLGSIYLDQKNYLEARERLTVLVENFPDYSVAYSLLGKVLESLEQPREAIEVYKKGIETASRKGDLMPLKEMQSRRNQLLQSVS